MNGVNGFFTGRGGGTGTAGTSGTTGTSGVSGNLYATTSTDSFTLGNSGTLTVDTLLSYTTAQSIIIAHDVSNFQESLVVSYNSGTGVLVFSAPTRTVGSGTYTSWSVNLNGASGTIASLSDINSEWTVGDVGALLLDGETTFTLNIGAGSIFQMGTFQVVLDGVVLPRNNNTRISYTVSYSAGIITVVMNQGAINGQLYMITGTYLVS